MLLIMKFDSLYAWDVTDKSRQSSLDIDLVDDRAWSGVVATDTRIYLSVFNDDTCYVYDFDGMPLTSENIDLIDDPTWSDLIYY